MIVAGVGCRAGCAAVDIVAVVREAEALVGRVATVLAAPTFKGGEAGVREAAEVLGVPLVFVDEAGMAAAQGGCLTRSAVVLAAVGVASVAEAAALAVSGGRLLGPRVGRGMATCALAVGADAVGRGCMSDTLVGCLG